MVQKMATRFLIVTLLWRIGRADWVEIPQLKPSSLEQTSITSSTTIKPATINGHMLTHSHLLLSHLSDDRIGGSRWTSPGSSSSSSSTSVRWHRPVSDLLDYNDASKSVTHQAVPAWITTTHRQDVRHQMPVSLVNVSTKVAQLGDNGSEEEEEEEEEDDDDQYPVVQTELLPFGNRYEEESIESMVDSGAPKAILHPQGVVSPVQHFDDFDDYDERLPQTVHGPQPDHSEQEQYVQEDGQEGGQGTEESSEEEAEEQEPEPPKKLNLRPPQPATMGLGGFFEFLRRMQASFVQRTAHTIGDKIRTLAGMRDQLLSTIEQRIAALWRGGPIGGQQQRRRRRRIKRGWMEPHADTEAMDFPSAEGALLTISFLTFAVFLIKLVLQVINTIKAKHYTYSTFAAATPVSGGLLVKRTRRHAIEPYELQAILGALEGFRPSS